MKKIWFFLILLGCNQYINAQYTDIINSKRPGNSESPYSVGTGVLQFESGLFYGNTGSEELFSTINPRGASLFTRCGVFNERFEINGQIVYQYNDFQFNNTFKSSTQISGVSQLNFGFKYLIYQRDYINHSKEIRSWKKRTRYDKNRWIPSIGIYIGVNTNWVNTDYQESDMTPRVALLLQNNLSKRLIILSNIGAYNINNNNSAYTYIITATYSINESLSVFIENQGDLSSSSLNPQVGTGLAYLFSRNLQFDFSARAYLDQVNPGFITGVGVAWRWDNHKDELIEVKVEKIEKIEEEGEGVEGEEEGEGEGRNRKVKEIKIEEEEEEEEEVKSGDKWKIFNIFKRKKK
ncbi:MAG: transporter [Flavobacteriaceae bacterium]|nr:transporter [Flavobacteriaceae bacterium]